LNEPRSNTVVVEAMAKVNLFLRVLGRRDDGYHDLETLVVPIDLADRLEIHAVYDRAEFGTLSLSLEVKGEAGLVRGVPVDESNLVLRAASALADRVQARGFAEIVLDKRVPAAAGLGGGSADAAATLKALNDLWGAGLGEADLLDVAQAVGSDVPALLAGGSVFVTGRGERLEPVRMAGLNLALATFSFGVATAEAFVWWDEDGASTGPEPAAILVEAERRMMAERGDLASFAELLFNDLEPPVIARHAVIGEVKDRLLEGGALAVVMSGSGPSLAALLPWDVPRLAPDVEEGVQGAAGRPLRYVESEPLGSPAG
jgi:4-diphosphocytidyl-2-C-methyl-D-erythritol kinase